MYTESIPNDLSTDIVTYSHEVNVDYSLFDPQLTRSEVAKEMNISLRTLYDYLTWGGEFNPHLSKYLSESNGLNRKKIDSVDIDYIQEIVDLRKRFTKDRVEQILKRKYGGINEGKC